MIGEIIHIIFWIGAISSLFLIVLLLLSILGSNIEMDVDADGEVDGGFGVFKSVMTFMGMSCLSMYALYTTTSLADVWLVTISILIGVISVLVLSLFLRWLLTKQEEGNWYLHETLNKTGEVYITIPPFGTGKVIIKINNIEREIDAKSVEDIEIIPREKVLVTEVARDHVIVMKIN